MGPRQGFFKSNKHKGISLNGNDILQLPCKFKQRSIIVPCKAGRLEDKNNYRNPGCRSSDIRYV